MKSPKITVGQDIVEIVAEIDAFKSQWQASKKLPPDRLLQLRRAAAVESIGASTRIAGAKLTDAQVEALLAEDSVSGYHLNDPTAVAGYAAAMALVVETHQDLDLSEAHVQRLHRILCCHSAEGSPQGNVNSAEMHDLLHWTGKAFDQATMHPLLITAVFKVAFLAIHPFPDGNGRLSRLLTMLLLLRAGYDYVAYASLDAVLEKDSNYYHKTLTLTQSTLDHDSPNWQPWLAFFLRCLKSQTSKLAPAVEYHQASDSEELPPLSMDVLVLLSQHHSLSITQIAESTGASQTTLKERLCELTEAGHIQHHGGAQSYSLPR